MVFLLLLLMGLCCYGNLKFPEIYNGKSESKSLFLSDYRYFDKRFTIMFLEHMNLVKLLNLISCHGKRKVNFTGMQHLQYFG